MQAEMLRMMREQSGLTTVKLAEILGTDKVNIWRWEKGKNEIKLSMFLAWCKACGFDFVLTQVLVVPTREEEE